LLRFDLRMFGSSSAVFHKQYYPALLRVIPRTLGTDLDHVAQFAVGASRGGERCDTVDKFAYSTQWAKAKLVFHGFSEQCTLKSVCQASRSVLGHGIFQCLLGITLLLGKTRN